MDSNEVGLTEEEQNLAITKAIAEKTIRLENIRRRLLIEKQQAAIVRPWSANELYIYAKMRADKFLQSQSGDPAAAFQIIDFQKPVMVALSLYFTNDSKFEELDSNEYNSNGLPLSLNKGIWLWGNPGVGKTMIMGMFSKNKRLSYEVIQCPKLTYQYSKEGDDVIAHFTKPLTTQAASADNFYQRNRGACYNDLGTEPTLSKFYGNPINVMEYLFLQSYDNSVPFFHRHVTTNLTMDQVKEMYGLRVLDRIKQSFNIIEIKGKSLRK